MNEQNLGMIERAIRMVLGLGLGAWILMQPELGAIEYREIRFEQLRMLGIVNGRENYEKIATVQAKENRLFCTLGRIAVIPGSQAGQGDWNTKSGRI